MSIIREKIRFNNSLIGLTGGTTGFTGTTMNLRISLSSTNNLIEYQEEIDRLTQFTTLDLVNPVTDGEERRFKLNPNPNANITLVFQFYSGSYSKSFLAAGFTANEIANTSENLLNSFFILDFYDTFDINSQTKIFTTYLTKILVPVGGIYYSQYTIGAANNNQFYRWYVPLSYIEAQTGSTVIGYVKLSFFNAKTGNVTTFYNADNVSLTTPEYMFFKTQLDLTGMTWKFMTTSYPTISANQIVNNPLFTDKVNNTVANKDDLQQNPPSGNTFNYQTGKYASNTKTIITPPTPAIPVAPTLGVFTVTAIVNNNAVGNGSVVNEGGATVYERGVIWNTSPSPTTANNKVTGGTGIGTFSGDMFPLVFNTTYYARAYASNIADTAYSNEVSFTTPPIAPIVSTQPITPGSITYWSAGGNGHIENNGGAAITAEGFKVGYSSGYLNTDIPVTTLSLPDFSANLGVPTALAADTTVFYQAYATNSVGIGYGGISNFKTLQVPPPSVTTIYQLDVTMTTATIRVGVSNTSSSYTISNSGIVWDTHSGPDQSSPHYNIGAIASSGVYYGYMTGLVPNQLYYVRSFIILASAPSSPIYGNEITFTTLPPSPPTLGTFTVTNIAYNNADGNSSIADDGGAGVVDYGVVWNTTPTPTTSDNHYAGTGTYPAFSANMFPLTFATTYYARAYARNIAGTSYSNEVSFTTPPIAPIVSTQMANSVTSNSAGGNGTVENNGGAAITAEGFMIGTNPSYITNNIPVATLSFPTFGAGLGLLVSNLTYYVQAYATNSVGTSYGGVVTFITLAPAPPTVTAIYFGHTSSTAIIKTGVAYNGSDSIIDSGIVWASASNPDQSSNKISHGAMSGTGWFDTTITGLSTSSTYHVRSYIIMASAPSSPIYSPEISFQLT